MSTDWSQSYWTELTGEEVQLLTDVDANGSKREQHCEDSRCVCVCVIKLQSWACTHMPCWNIYPLESRVFPAECLWGFGLNQSVTPGHYVKLFFFLVCYVCSFWVFLSLDTSGSVQCFHFLFDNSDGYILWCIASRNIQSPILHIF